MKILAYAKINLALDITGRLENGYHTLALVNHSVDLTDEVEIELADSITINCDDPDTPTDNTNTCYKAAELFFSYINVKSGANITICKKIPSQAGLGGASADAAAVLIGLNALTNSNLTLEQLTQIGVKVGADVPFCLTGGAALCTGIGEKITSLPPLTKGEFIIVKPKIGISTAEAYRRYDEFSGEICRPDINGMAQAVKNNDIATVGAKLCNVLEPVSSFTELAEIKKLLGKGSHGAVMTGSGSAIFGVFDDGGLCDEELFSGAYGKVYRCKPVSFGTRFIEI